MINRLKHTVKRWRRERRHRMLVTVSARAWRQVKSLKHLVICPLAHRQLKRFSAEDLSLDELVSAAFDRFGGIIAPIQLRTEARAFFALVRELRPRRVLEIGTANGGTLFLLCRSAAADAHVYSIDLPGGWFGGGYPAWKTFLYSKFAMPNQRIELIRADSHRQDTFEYVKQRLAGDPLDCLFLDGDHTYQGIRDDFLRYHELVRAGGIIALHDIVPNRFDPDCQVSRLWAEIKNRFRAHEIVENWAQAGKGIGVLRP